MRFHIRWPDGRSESCYSPSLVIKDYFVVGTDYLNDGHVTAEDAWASSPDGMSSSARDATSSALDSLDFGTA